MKKCLKCQIEKDWDCFDHEIISYCTSCVWRLEKITESQRDRNSLTEKTQDAIPED